MEQVLTVEPAAEVAIKKAVFYGAGQGYYYWASLRRTLVR
jgi:hypothetical protein